MNYTETSHDPYPAFITVFATSRDHEIMPLISSLIELYTCVYVDLYTVCAMFLSFSVLRQIII